MRIALNKEQFTMIGLKNQAKTKDNNNSTSTKALRQSDHSSGKLMHWKLIMMVNHQELDSLQVSIQDFGRCGK